MRKILIFSIVLLACVFISGGLNNSANAQSSTKTSALESCGSVKSCFLVVSNEMQSVNSRRLEVFMEKSAFSEENLRQIFKYLAAQNIDAKVLIINVKTNWNELSFPDGRGKGFGSSNRPYDPTIFYSYHAIYHRSHFPGIGRREYFKYNPELKVDKYKTVWIKSESK